ncbi:hypothetical protein WN943_016110 [Citrus x changshan-huyou]|uniref:Uncharacterized protein n=1 Tax=Citrus unshiu TaxID=55188 RepID=A0A2H5PLR3_CITUN|nr:hypothetical protein CUMW_148120 [Citrus unshiu]
MKLEMKKMESEAHAADQESLSKFTTLILGFCISIASVVWFLPHENIDGDLVPDLKIFTEHPVLFHALVITLILSFSGASGALLIRNFSRHATAWRCYFGVSLVSVASALLILVCTVFLEIVRLDSSGFKLWQLNEKGADSLFLHSHMFQVFRKICPASQEISEIT